MQHSLYTSSTLPIVEIVVDAHNNNKIYQVYKSRRNATHYIQQFVNGFVASRAIRINRSDLKAIYGVEV